MAVLRPVVANMRDMKSKPNHNWMRIDRKTKWGNPHPIGWCRICQRKHDRREAITRFEDDLFDDALDITVDDVEQEMAHVEGLGCWCAPEPCHGDVYSTIIENKRKQDVMLTGRTDVSISEAIKRGTP